MSLKDDRVLAHLLKALVERGLGWGGLYERDDVVEMILSLGDRRTIVTLADHVGDDREVGSIQYGRDGDEITVRVGDLALGVILKQTQQKLADYGFYGGGEMPVGPGETGFQTDEKRRAARAKFRKWWAEHRKEYAGVQKVPLGAPPRGGDDGGRPELPAFIRGLIE